MTTPNMFNMDLWVQSGHAQHYKENMFRFDVEGSEFGAFVSRLVVFRASHWTESPLRLRRFLARGIGESAGVVG